MQTIFGSKETVKTVTMLTTMKRYNDDGVTLFLQTTADVCIASGAAAADVRKQRRRRTALNCRDSLTDHAADERHKEAMKEDRERGKERGMKKGMERTLRFKKANKKEHEEEKENGV